MSKSSARMNSEYTWATKPGTTMVFTLVPVIRRPWTTSGVAKRRVTRRPYGTAMQRGTNMNCVAMTRTVTPPSAPTVVPRLCSANSPDRCSVLGSIRSTLLGGFMSAVSAVNTITPRTAAMSTPTPKAHSNSVPRIRRSRASAACSVTGLPHRSAWKEDEQINRQVAEHQQGDSGAGQDAGAMRHHAHDLRERGLIDLIGDLGRIVGSRSLIGRDHRLAPAAAPQRLRS